MTARSAGSCRPFSDAQKSDCRSRSEGVDTGTVLSQRFRLDGTGTLGFGQHVLDRRDVVVPLDQGRDAAKPAYCIAIEVPDLGADSSVVRVEQVGAAVAVTGQVDLTDPGGRKAREVVAGAEAVVHGADEHVVHVEQDAAVGGFGDRGEKRPLGHRRMGEGEVAGDVLQQDATTQPVLYAPYALDDVSERLVRERQGQQVVRVALPVASPAQ